MRSDEEAVRQVLSAQMGKAGPPMCGKDLHTGDWAWGVLPAAAPLSIGSLQHRRPGDGVLAQGHRARRLLVHRRGRLVARRMARSHQPVRGAQAAGGVLRGEQPDGAVDAGARELRGPRVRRQGRRLRHSRHHHRRHRSRRGRRGVHLGRRSRARAGAGPALIELVSMRMCGHAHHDDMLYHGKESQPSWDYPPLTTSGYADRELYEFWSKRDPIARYAARARERRRSSSAASSTASSGGPRSWSRRRRGWSSPRRGPSRTRPASACSRTSRRGSAIEVLDPERRGRLRRLRPGFSPGAAAARAGPAVRQEGQHAARSRDARRWRRAARRPAGVRLRPGRRRPVRQRVPAAAAAARRSSAIASSTRRWPKARCSACASAPRWPDSGRSARCSSTTSSPPASISW